MKSKHSDKLLILGLNLTPVIFWPPADAHYFLDLFPAITLRLSIIKLRKTTSVHNGSRRNGKIERENIYQLGECLFYLKSHSWCVITLAVCAWVWESRWTLFTLEESEKPGSPILKLTGPFGSNHQMCHGKRAPCHTARDAKPLPASIFSFKASNWCQCDRAYVHQTLFPIIYRCFSSGGSGVTKDEWLSLYFPWPTQMSQGEVWQTNRQKKGGDGFYQRHPSN